MLGISYQKNAWNIYTQIHDMLKFFLRGFQFMVLAFDDNFLLWDQNTNKFLVYVKIEP